MSTTTAPGHSHDVSLIWNVFPFNYQFMGLILWFIIGSNENDQLDKWSDWWNYTQYIAYGVYTVVDSILNAIFFPFYLFTLPLTDLWNLIPNVAMAVSVGRDITQYGIDNMTQEQYTNTIISAVMMFADS